ncbi:DUF1254 domain-containing protein [Lacinutrix jangbogonensis]|uniref:DUF1254 domain-containing protein n=1 Tax=Lacinutrix jangbogonensis TaxID=1469557 RepID=UPI00053DEAB6|nr:DUF1254 domain-containing protein [Lacinutrix jangbogonensis]
MKKTILAVILLIAVASCQSTKKEEKAKADKSTSEKAISLDAFFSDNGRMVTAETYPTAETSRQILKSQDLVGVNTFLHLRQLTQTDNQPVVRMNRDTYYSMAVLDVSKGASITMPEIPEGKYMSIQPVTEDHRIQAMKYGPGKIELNTHIGSHLYLIVRLDGTFTESEANEIQDKMLIEANSTEIFSAVPVNKESFDKVENELKSKLPVIVKRDGVSGMQGMFTDPQDESGNTYTDEKHQLGAAIGWGGAQMVDNIYESAGDFSTGDSYQLTFEDPGNKAFWSVTVYDKNGFIFNDLANFSSNTAKRNEDGTYTLSFGCRTDAPNNIEIDNPTRFFNITIRHYQPSEKVYKQNYRIAPLMKVVSKE